MKPVDNKNTQEEAGNAEQRNPSGGDSIGSLLRPAKTHCFRKRKELKNKASSLLNLSSVTKKKPVTPSTKKEKALKEQQDKKSEELN